MKKREAIIRMIALGLDHKIINIFKDHDKVIGSAESYLTYLMTARTQTQLIQDAITELKSIDPDAVPYYYTLGRLRNGQDTFLMCNVLFVSSHHEDWQYERPKARNEDTFTIQCLAYNCGAPELSDIGVCMFRKSEAGTLLRIR